MGEAVKKNRIQTSWKVKGRPMLKKKNGDHTARTTFKVKGKHWGFLKNDSKNIDGNVPGWRRRGNTR